MARAVSAGVGAMAVLAGAVMCHAAAGTAEKTQHGQQRSPRRGIENVEPLEPLPTLSNLPSTFKSPHEFECVRTGLCVRVMWSWGTRKERASSTSDYLSMEDGRVTPLVSSSPLPMPGYSPNPESSTPRDGLRARFRNGCLLQLLRRQTPTAVSSAGENVEALRRRWASEKQMLIADCTAARSELATLTQTLNGWQALVRDILFYGGLHGRAAEMTAQFAEQLRGSLGELEIVQEVEVTELHLPSAPDHSPQVRLIKYCGPELSEWNVLWEPSNAQVKRCQAEYCW